MSIPVETQHLSVARPAQLAMINKSGADVEVFVFIGDLPAVHHAFSFKQSVFTESLTGLVPGVHATTVFVRAIKNLNRMYSLIVTINGEIVAVADGDIPADRLSDSGTGDFSLTVGEAA